LKMKEGSWGICELDEEMKRAHRRGAVFKAVPHPGEPRRLIEEETSVWVPYSRLEMTYDTTTRVLGQVGGSGAPKVALTFASR